MVRPHHSHVHTKVATVNRTTAPELLGTTWTSLQAHRPAKCNTAAEVPPLPSWPVELRTGLRSSRQEKSKVSSRSSAPASHTPFRVQRTACEARGLHSALRADDLALHKRLLRVRALAGVDESVSALRVFDISR
ncbi:DUF6308 family protein [Ornithinimicrobium pratense]|uniref:DUF6308 family protein n=1 Tax=Ornithinimicrobium pratense TaxID=2593973 RepID=UPI003B5278CB